MTEPQAKSPNDETPGNAPDAEDIAPNEKADPAQGEIAKLKDQLLRALADAENTRKRAQKEREDTAKYAVANFAKAMLDVSDNFRRALEAVPKEDTDAGLKNLMAGIEATERQLLAAFERFGVKKIEPRG